MLKKYGPNEYISENIENASTWSPVLIFASAIPFLFCIVGLFHFIDKSEYYKRDYAGLHTILWVLLIIYTIMSVIGYNFYQKEDVKKGSAIQGGLIGTTFFFSLIYAFNEDYEDFKTYMLVFMFISLAALISYYYSIFKKSKTSQPITENIKNCFLELHDDYICGYSFNNVVSAGDGYYFEIKYVDIRNIRSETSGIYNLYIDHSSGTYKLSIRKPYEAADNIKKIIKIVKNGDVPTEELLNPRNYSKIGNDIIYINGNNGRKCKTCNNIIESLPCKYCGETSVNQANIPIKIEINNKDKIICPICKTEQLKTRTRCFKCGQVFINGNSTPYWCANCGQPGPFNNEGEICTFCGSTDKLINENYQKQ